MTPVKGSGLRVFAGIPCVHHLGDDGQAKDDKQGIYDAEHEMGSFWFLACEALAYREKGARR